MDDIPIGGGNNDKFKDEQPPQQQAANPDADKPLPDRLVSKAWAVRADAYKELYDIYKNAAPNSATDPFRDHIQNWPKFLADGNPGALEKALDAFNSCLDKIQPQLLADNQVGMFKPMVEKCLCHAKPVIKSKSLECLLLIFEVSENFGEDTITALEELCKAKLAKTQTTALMAVAQLISNYGIKKFPAKIFLPLIKAGATGTNPGLKTEGMNGYKALQKWMGDALEPLIQDLKKQQIEELQKYKEETKDKPKDKRMTRSEKEAAKEAAIDALIEEESKEDAAADAFDMAEEVDVFSKFNPEWMEKLMAMKKWNEKKGELEQIIEASNVPKIKPGDCSHIVEGLKKLIGDSNIVVAQHAIKLVGCLAKGLRAPFEPHCPVLIPPLIARLKEKRPAFIEEIQTSLASILLCVKLVNVLEPIQPGIKDKAPGIRKNVLIFLETNIKTTYIDDLEDAQGTLVPAVMPVVDDKDPDAREAGLKCIGALKGRLPEGSLSKYLDGIIPQKMTKIDEAAAQIKPSKYDKSERKAAAAAKKAAMAKKKAPPAKPQTASKAPDDEEMLDNFAPPKKVAKPPARLANKAAAKPSADVEMKDESETLDSAPAMAPPKKKAPPNIGQKPAPKAASKPAAVTKAPTGPKIEEEDLGSGLDKEAAIEKVKETFDAAHVAKFEEAKWNLKVEGFTGIQEQIAEMKPDAVVIEALCKFIKAKMKDWKESNLNLMKQALTTLQVCCEHCEKINKRSVAVYMPFMSDKIGDVKMLAMVHEILMSLSEFCTSKFIALQIIKYAATAKAPNTLKESCNMLGKLTEEFGIGMMPIKEMIDYAKVAAAHSNVQVRNASMALFAVIYKHAGEAIRAFLTDIKESTLKLIDAELDKVTPLKKGEFKSNRQVKGDAAEEIASAPAASLDDALPREDISKQLNSKLMALFKDKDWKNRKKAADSVEEILRGAKMRIKPEGLNELYDALKNGMKDPNKSVLKVNIALLGLMAEAVGEPIKNNQKKLLVPLIFNMSDKQSLVRADTIVAVNKWSEAVGANICITHITAALAQENPELRDEGLKWILSNKEEIKTADHTAMIKPLISCLSDKAGKIRVAAEEVIVAVMGYIGAAPFTAATKDLKPAVQQVIKPILDKAKAKSGATSGPVAEEEPEKPAAKASSKAAPAKQPAAAARTSNKTQPAAAAKKEPAQSSFAKAAANKKAAPPAPAAKEEAEEEGLAINVGNKDARFQKDMKSKWMHEELQKNQIESTKVLCEQVFGYETMQKMFCGDFKKHVAILNQLQGKIETDPDGLMGCLDVIFKWIYIKVTESQNTTLAVAVFDFCDVLMKWLNDQEYTLWENEAFVLIPLLCEKIGINNAILKEKVRQLIRTAFIIYDQTKAYALLFKYGAGAKNLKSVAECLNELAWFITENGLTCTSDKDLKFVAKLADSGDKGVREGALCVLGEAYKHLDEDIWRVIGNVTVKVKGLLEGRFKKIKPAAAQPAPAARPQTAKVQPGVQNKIGAGNSNMTRSFLAQQQAKKTATTPRGSNLQFNKNQNTTSKLGQGALAKSINNNMTTSIKSNNSGSGGGAMGNNFSGQKRHSMMPQTSQAIAAKTFSGGFADGLRNSEASNKLNNQDDNIEIPQNEDVIMNDNALVDDDDDLRDLENILEPVHDDYPEFTRQIETLKKQKIQERIQALVNINKTISEAAKHKEMLAAKGNDLVDAHTVVLNDCFDREIVEIPARFAKYFITIVNQTCCCKEVMNHVSEPHLLALTEQLLTRLLTDGLDKIGEEQEGEIILRNLNGSMLRLLENSNHTYIFCVLFNLLSKYRESTQYPKLPSLIIKCLLKLSKILEKLIARLQMDKILLSIHHYMALVGQNQQMTQNDEMGVRIVKTILNELVKLKKEDIWEAYQVIEEDSQPDKQIFNWINIVLKSVMGNAYVERKPGDIIKKKDPVSQAEETLTAYVNEVQTCDVDRQKILFGQIDQFLKEHPDIVFDDFLQRNCQANTVLIVKDQYNRYKAKQAADSAPESGSRTSSSGPKFNTWMNRSQAARSPVTVNTQPQDTPTPTSTDKSSKMATFQQRKQLMYSDSKPRITEIQSNQSSGIGGGTSQTQRSSLGVNNQQSKLVGMYNKSSTITPSTTQQQTSATSTSDRLSKFTSKLNQVRMQKAQSNEQAASTSSGRKFQAEANKTITQTSSVSNLLSTKKEAASKNMNTSFSAMNSSLQQKWSAINKKPAAAKQNEGQESGLPRFGAANTDTTTRLQTEVPGSTTSAASNLNLSNNGAAQGQPQKAQRVDLDTKLAEMKARFANLKKQ